MNGPATSHRAGLVAAFGAYALWGLLPLYLHRLTGLPAADVLAHRITWSALVLAVVGMAVHTGPGVAAVLGRRRQALLLLGSAAAIGINWLVYTFAILQGHVLDASMGYFINPLLNVALGVALLGERLGRVQWAAVALAAAGVVVQALAIGRPPWISLGLAVSFAVYGLLRKKAAVDGLVGLIVETTLLLPFALAWLAWHAPALAALPLPTWGLLVAAGPITAAPLLLFGRAARVLPLSTLGLIQYLAPTLVMVQAVWLFGETLSPMRLAAFSCIWAGLVLYAWGALRPAAAPLASGPASR